MRARLLFVVALTVVATRPAHASDIAATTSAVDAATRSLVTWAKSQPKAPLAKEILDLEPFLKVTPLDGTYEGSLATQRDLALIAARLGELSEKLARHRDELLYGAARPETPPEEALLPETIDVRSLVFMPPEFPRPTLGLPRALFERPPASEGAGLTFGNESRYCRTLGIELGRLRDLVETLVPSKVGSVDMSGGFLIVHRQPRELREIRALIDELRATLEPVRVGLDVRAFVIPHAVFTRLDRAGPVLSPAGQRSLEEALRAGATRLLGRQSLVAVDGQITGALLAETHTLTVPGDTAGAGSITPSTYATGLRVQVVPTLAFDRKSLLLHAQLSYFERRPLDPGAIDLPDLGFARAATVARIPLGATALVAGAFAATGAGDATACVVAVRPTLALAAKTTTPAPPPETAPPQPLPQSSAAGDAAPVDEVLQVVRRALVVVRASSAIQLRAFDVREILDELPDWPGIPLRAFDPARAYSAASEDEMEESGNAVDPAKLLELVKTRCGGDGVWEAPAFVELHRGALLVRQSPAVLERVAAILDELHARANRFVCAEATAYRLDADLARDLVDPATPGRLSPAALARLDEAASEDRRAHLLAGAFTTLASEQRGHAATGRERVYVAGVGSREGALAPRLSFARTGFELDFRANPEKDSVTISGRLEMTRTRDVRKTATTWGPVEAPSLGITQEPFDATLAPGWAVLLERQELGDASVTAVVIRATAVPVR